MRTVFIITGIAAVLMGLLWIAQGAGIVGWPEASIMLNESRWTRRGMILVGIGLVLMYFARRWPH